MKSLKELQATHPLVYQHFSKLAEGEFWVHRIQELDSYWSRIGQANIPEAILDGSKLPSNISIAGEFDLIYAGATLGPTCSSHGIAASSICVGV